VAARGRICLRLFRVGFLLQSHCHLACLAVGLPDAARSARIAALRKPGGGRAGRPGGHPAAWGRGAKGRFRIWAIWYSTGQRLPRRVGRIWPGGGVGGGPSAEHQHRHVAVGASTRCWNTSRRSWVLSLPTM